MEGVAGITLQSKERRSYQRTAVAYRLLQTTNDVRLVTLNIYFMRKGVTDEADCPHHDLDGLSVVRSVQFERDFKEG